MATCVSRANAWVPSDRMSVFSISRMKSRSSVAPLAKRIVRLPVDDCIAIRWLGQAIELWASTPSRVTVSDRGYSAVMSVSGRCQGCMPEGLP